MQASKHASSREWAPVRVLSARSAQFDELYVSDAEILRAKQRAKQEVRSHCAVPANMANVHEQKAEEELKAAKAKAAGSSAGK